jgi:YHS domain-containing protein
MTHICLGCKERSTEVRYACAARILTACMMVVNTLCHECDSKLKGSVYFTCSQECQDAAFKFLHLQGNFVVDLRDIKAVYYSANPSDLLEDLEVISVFLPHQM